MKCEIALGGNAEQETREGYNLIDWSNIALSSAFSGGFNNDILSLTGDGSYAYQAVTIDLLNLFKSNAGKTITIQVESATSSNNEAVREMQIYYEDTTQHFLTILDSNNARKNVTIPSDISQLKSASLRIFTNNSSSLLSNTVIFVKPMLYIGTATAVKPYEQYGASPSPNYPSPIKTVGQNVNIFNCKDTYTNNGITLTKNEDGSFKVEGTAVSSGSFRISDYFKIKGINTFSYEVLEGNSSVWFWNQTDNNSNLTFNGTSKQTVEFVEEKEIALAFSAVAGTTYFFTARMKISEGTETGGYSPYGQGSVEIEVCNKNHFDINGQIKASNCTYEVENNSINVTANYSYAHIEQIIKGLIAGERYVFSNDTNASWITVNALDNTKIAENYSSNKLSFIAPQGGIIKLRIYVTTSSTSGTKTFTNLQVEKDSSATDYIPHESYTKVLPIQKEFVKIGDVEDTFVRQDGKWYEAHYSPKYTITGNETILNSTALTDVTRHIIQVNNIDNAQGLCNYYKHLRSYTSDTEHFYLSTNQIIFFDKENSSTAFMNRLKSLYDNNTPVTIYPTLNEPELIPCTAEQESILNSFYTYKNVTNISMSGIGTLKVNYKKDLETIINNINSALLS